MQKKNKYRRFGSKTPQSAASVLEQTLSAYRIDRKIKEYEAFPHWVEIVGDDIAKVAVPEKIIQGKILVVKVIDAVWVQELSMRKQEILDTIYSSKHEIFIEDIQFITGDPKSIANSKL